MVIAPNSEPKIKPNLASVNKITIYRSIKKLRSGVAVFELTCPTDETPLSVLPHLEYCDFFLSPTKSLVFSRALKISDCMTPKSV